MSLISRESGHLSVAAKEQSPEAYATVARIHYRYKIISLVFKSTALIALIAASYLGVKLSGINSLTKLF